MMDLTYTCSICFPPAVTVCPFFEGFSSLPLQATIALLFRWPTRFCWSSIIAGILGWPRRTADCRSRLERATNSLSLRLTKATRPAGHRIARCFLGGFLLLTWQTLVKEATFGYYGDLMLGVRGRLILSTSHQLQNHYDEIKGRAYVKNAMIFISQRHAALRARLQEADGGAMIAGVVGSAVSPAVSRSWYGAGIAGVRGGSEGGAQRQVQACRRQLQRCWILAAAGMRLGSLAPPTEAQEAQGPTPGPSGFLSLRPPSTRRRVPGGSPCPAWEERAAPMQCAAIKHWPEACITGKTRSDGNRWWSRCEHEKCTDSRVYAPDRCLILRPILVWQVSVCSVGSSLRFVNSQRIKTVRVYSVFASFASRPFRFVWPRD